MEKHNLRSVIVTASVVLGLSAVWPAHADTFVGALGAGADATDSYDVTCPIGTVSAASVRTNVNDLNVGGGVPNGIQVSVQVINPHGRADTESAVDAGFFSADATLDGGAGSYLVTVHKDAAGGEGYAVNMDCYNGAGALAGIQSVLVQDR